MAYCLGMDKTDYMVREEFSLAIIFGIVFCVTDCYTDHERSIDLSELPAIIWCNVS